ncbi:transcription initiation factor TFIID subunit 3-like isoform X2 [Ischnura elegans]|uniref:transcription initiation factor TFIID subunit 3-like isoform X2 n=1 Tax=Ischnura elegans TaxID=197161 RepID=UPI001ED88B52|nr:transcription initiation factor TFIID subunit 3-like isoform X2 [Ischnura elegans]
MTSVYTKSALRVVVAQICQTIGWHTIQNSALEILVDILHHYIADLTKLTHRYSELYGYTIPNLDHLALAFRDLGINLDELEEYVQFVEAVPCAKDIPKYPIPRESHLNFLKPGSREVVHRPVHVHEHLPPMHPEMEEDEYNGKQNINSAETAGSSNGSSPLHSPKAGVFKRPGEPISSESSASKRLRSAPEEEGRPLREITSVIMTTSGFLSPAREGKLPESRIPVPPSDSRSNSPLPPSYPMVPPEVKGEKKSKKGTLKKSLDGLKRLDKENKKKEAKSKESKKNRKHMLIDDSKVKKLISMKEFSKLKAFKAGALKLMARSTSGTPSTPKTPELPTPARKLEKIMEKKKKKDKSKSKKDSKAKLAKELLNAKKIKVELNDYENSGRPKTPEVPEPQESAHTPVFPFFPSFPPAPGLIPPPLGHHPLFPRFPYSGLPKPAGSSGATGQQPAPSSNLPHPAMPNLPLPPALFMQPRPDGPPEVKDEPPERPSVPAPQPIVSPPAPVVVKTEKTVEKSQPVHPLTPKEKVVEKKSKEHKKEKKDKDKVKKKKDKKDKGKGKEKSEKKRDKEEKKDREKGKEKKEKKEKKKDKEREDKSEKSETSVPKLTLKLPPSASSPRPSTPDTQSRKLVIKTVVKKNAPEERPPSAGSNESLSKRAPSPELAKFSALITRPPKQKGSSKVPHLESESSSSLHHQPIAEESLPPAPHHHVAPTPPPAPVSLPPPPPEQPPPPPQVPHHPPPSVPPPPSVIPPPPLATPPAPSTSSLPLGGLSASTKAKKGLTKPFSKVKQPKDSSKRPLPPEADAPKAFYFDTHGNKIWICPACGGQDDGSPMIGCDDCDAWYHWVCVGMQVPPDDNEDWYCRVCIVKKEESLVDKKKKARKKK